MTSVPCKDLTVSSDGKSRTLQIKDVPIIDQPRWPAMDAETTPAWLDFKVVLKSADEPVKYEDPTRQYRFKTGPLAPSGCDFAGNRRGRKQQVLRTGE